MEKAEFGVALFPFLKTSAAVRLGPYEFRCTTDLEGLPGDQAAAVSEIASMLFLRDDLRIARAAYAITPPLGVYRPGPVGEACARLRAVVAYLYSAPHPTSGDVFLSHETVSLVLLSPQPVSVFLVRPEHGTTPPLEPPSPGPDARNELPGYEGSYNIRHPVWLTRGSRLYGPKPQMSLNISQDLAADLGEPDRFSRPDGPLLLEMLSRPMTALGERVFAALDWYNAANADEADPNQALLSLAVAFETLLRLPGPEKTDRLVDAISLLLGRTERLVDWAAQFYAARSQVAHEGRVRDWWFYAVGAPKQGLAAHPFGSLMTYGRQIFQLCVAAILVGGDMAERAGLKERLVANSERYAAISKGLDQPSKPSADRLMEIAPAVEGLKRFRWVASGGLTVPAMLGAVRAAASTLLERPAELEESLGAALRRFAATTRKTEDLDSLAALSEVAEAYKERPSASLEPPERVVADLVELAWSDLFMIYYRLKEDAGRSGRQGG